MKPSLYHAWMVRLQMFLAARPIPKQQRATDPR